MFGICKSFLFLFLPYLGISQSPIAASDDSDGPLKKSIIFHENKKILLAEKFINVEFLLPFSQFAVSIKSDLAHLLKALQKFAEPNVMHMTALKNPFRRELSHVTPFTSTILIGIASFIISMLLHLLFMYIFHRCNNLHKFMPFKHTYKDKDEMQQKVKVKHVLSVPKQHLSVIQNDPNFRWQGRCLLTEHPNDTHDDQRYTTLPL